MNHLTILYILIGALAISQLVLVVAMWKSNSNASSNSKREALQMPMRTPTP